MIKYIKPSEKYEKVKKIATEGISRGVTVGYKTVDENISFKPGYTTLIYGAPRAGKSQFAIQCMNSMSEREGVKHLIYMPEAGSDEELMADIIMNYLGISLFGDDARLPSVSDFDRAVDFMDAHYTIIPQMSKVDLYSLYRDIKDGNTLRKPDMLWIDHVGWCKRPVECERMPLHEYVKDICQKSYLSSNILGIHTVMVQHTSSDNKPVQDKDTGIWYTPRPLPEYIAYGSEWYKNSYQVISMWRPAFGLINPETGFPYDKNEVVITVDKSKPKGIGHCTKFSMYFHVGKQRYYEKIESSKYYAGEYYQLTRPEGFTENKPLPVSAQFDFGDDEAPF